MGKRREYRKEDFEGVKAVDDEVINDKPSGKEAQQADDAMSAEAIRDFAKDSAAQSTVSSNSNGTSYSFGDFKAADFSAFAANMASASKTSVKSSSYPSSYSESNSSSEKGEDSEDVAPIDYGSPDFDLSGFDIETSADFEQYLDEESEYGKLPHPNVFNAYPPELQRKIMEWTERDVKARRDDESRRRDEVMRAEIDRTRRGQMFPAIITVLSLICGAVTGVITANPLFPLAFLLVPLAVIAARVAGVGSEDSEVDYRNKPPKI